MTVDPYMTKTQALLRDGKAMLDGLRDRADKAGAGKQARIPPRVEELEARYADVTRRFELLRAAGTEGVADLKVGLEKAWDAFRSEIAR